MLTVVPERKRKRVFQKGLINLRVIAGQFENKNRNGSIRYENENDFRNISSGIHPFPFFISRYDTNFYVEKRKYGVIPANSFKTSPNTKNKYDVHHGHC